MLSAVKHTRYFRPRTRYFRQEKSVPSHFTKIITNFAHFVTITNATLLGFVITKLADSSNHFVKKMSFY
jgi:hypothetical protein